MARHASAIKRNRQNAKRQLRNRWWKSRVRSATKNVLTAVEKKDKKAASEGLRMAAREFYKARSKGVFHANAAANRLARLSRLVSAL